LYSICVAASIVVGASERGSHSHSVALQSNVRVAAMAGPVTSAVMPLTTKPAASVEQAA
jgi:hypothetical protein